MEDVSLTSRATFDLSNFTLAVDYMAMYEKPPGWMDPRKASLWGTKRVVAPEVVVPTGPVKKPAEPKLKKGDLIKMVAEMKAELERLKPLEARFEALEAETNELREQLRKKNERLDAIRKALEHW